MSCVTVLWGRDGSGKTHTALTWPHALLLDNDRRYALLRFWFGAMEVREIYVPDDIRDGTGASFMKSWESHIHNIDMALRGSWETLIVDTLTTVRAIGVRATPPHERHPAPFHYLWVHNQIETMVKRIRSSGKHLVLTHRARPAYEDMLDGKARKTGLLEIQGWADVRYMADLILRMEVEGTLIKATVEKCGWTKSLNGIVLFDPTYEMLMTIILAKLAEEK